MVALECGCEPADLHNEMPYDIGNYGRWSHRDFFTDKYESLNTRMFTREHSDVKILCPRHDKFFQYLIEDKLNRDVDTYSKCIWHAWYHVPSKSLKLLWNWDCENKNILQNTLRFGLRKAWRMHTQDTLSSVKTYHYDCGDTVSDDDDEYD